MGLENTLISWASLSRNSPALVWRQTPYETVRRVEDFVEMPFGPFPEEARFSKYNRLALRLHASLDPWLRRELRVIEELGIPGQYLPTYHLSLYRRTGVDEQHSRTHEIAHALARNINPLTMRIGQTRLGILSNIVVNNPKYIEGQAVYKVLQEGFAEWVADETVGRVIPIPYTPEQIIWMLGEYIKSVENAKAKAAGLPPRYRLSGGASLSAPYEYGKFFVAGTVEELMEAGFTKAEAIKRVLETPPGSLEDLLDPDQYAASITQTGFDISELRKYEVVAKYLLGQ